MAEVGADMGRFATAGHLASWAGMCPGNKESAAAVRTHPPRRHLAQDRPVHGRRHRRPKQEHLPRGPVGKAGGVSRARALAPGSSAGSDVPLGDQNR
ncbi:transposase [Streptomyces sp. NPDC013172]|uniref:transposase n=1 Tax=Streptomyces sp. NPDC013172 TaxID=3155009 RepID=UPI0033EB0D2D